jgi:hypothetical protein
MLGLMTAPPTAAASTLTVRVTADRPDTDPGDGACDSTADPSTTKCTLRAAIQEANADPREDRIRFAITTGSGEVKTIAPRTALPAITQPLVIDATTQAGASPNTASVGTNARLRVVLDGVGLASSPGIQARARVTVRGLVIGRFARGIQLSEGSDGSLITGNFIGTDVTGRLDRGNGGSGILVNASDVRIGSLARADRNLISGNGSAGIDLGIASRRAVVQGNLIGTKRGGAQGLPNDGDGIFVTGSDGHLIGGGSTAQGNVIAFNRRDGVGLVTVSSPSLGTLLPNHVRILRDAIFGNAGIGIDLGDDGFTPNDPVPDPDTGPNGLQNFPRLDSVVVDSSETTITGRLASRRGVRFEIQLYQSAAGDPEGRTFLGSFVIRTGADGRRTFTFHTSFPLALGTIVTATATDLERSQTSEFGPARVATAP